MLCLHLLQLSMVYINTLMLQQVIKESHWPDKMVDDALIQPYSGHENRASLEVYSNLADAQESYDENIKDFPV